MNQTIAGIDVHKRMVMIVIVNGADPNPRQRRRFGTTTGDLIELQTWLKEQAVDEVVMESTAQYWKPVWLTLEGHFKQSLAQAWSNRARRGKKTDFKDAERLARRHLAGELTLSFVPDPAQRQVRSLTRRRVQLVGDRVRIQNQVESLLEETRVKVSSVLKDLFGASGLRILSALAKGETDPAALVALIDVRVQKTPEELKAALTGNVSQLHRKLLQQHLDHLKLVDGQLEDLSLMTAEALREERDPVERLVEIPGIRVLAAQQIIAEAGAKASAFDSPEQFSSWIGTCPGREESAEQNHSSRTTKGNCFLRRILTQVAQAAVKTKNCFFQQKFKRLLPRLGYVKALWAIARHLSVVIWKILHEGVRYIEYGGATTPQAAKRRVQRIKQQLRSLGYSDELKPLPRTVPAT